MSTNKNTHHSILRPTNTRAGDVAIDAQQPRTAADAYVDREYHRAHGPLSIGEKAAIVAAGAAVVTGLVYGGTQVLKNHNQAADQTIGTTHVINNQKN